MNTHGAKRQVSRTIQQLWVKANVPVKIKVKFSVLSLLVLITLVSFWLAKLSSDAREQLAAAKSLKQLGCSVGFDTNNWVPAWLQDAIGEEYFRTVRKVNFFRTASSVTDANLGHLECLSDLKELNLGNNPKVTDAGLVHLRGLKNLTYLALYGTGVQGPGLVHVSDLPRLKSVTLIRTDLRDSGLKHLGSMPNLKWASLDRTKVTDTGMAELARATTLQRLSLKGTDMTDDGLKHLEQLKGLRILDLVGTYVTAQGVTRFKQAVPECQVSVSYGLGIVPSQELLFPESYQPTLTEIDAKLRQLQIGEVYSSPDNSIVTLTMYDCTLSDKVLLALVEKIPNLYGIYLRHTLVGEEFLKGICGKEIRELTLGSTRITDEDLRYLSQLPKLERLDLLETSVTDQGLLHLHHLRNLKSMELQENTRVTSKGTWQLRQALPNCAFIGEVPLKED